MTTLNDPSDVISRYLANRTTPQPTTGSPTPAATQDTGAPPPPPPDGPPPPPPPTTPPSTPAPKHPIQPKPTQAPPLNIPGSYRPGRVADLARAHPTAALGNVMHHAGGITAPASGASATPRMKTQANPTRLLQLHTIGTAVPVGPHQILHGIDEGRPTVTGQRQGAVRGFNAIPKYLLPDSGSRTRMRQGYRYLEHQLTALDRSLKEELGGRTLKPFQVAALVGSFSWESHLPGTRQYFDPRTRGVGGAFGLAGWGGGRLSDLEQFALGSGHHSVGDLLGLRHLFGDELAFAVHELRTDRRSAFEALVKTTTLAGANGAEAVVEQKYEVNADRYQVGPNAPHLPSDTASYWYRLQLAQYVLSHLAG